MKNIITYLLNRYLQRCYINVLLFYSMCNNVCKDCWLLALRLPQHDQTINTLIIYRTCYMHKIVHVNLILKPETNKQDQLVKLNLQSLDGRPSALPYRPPCYRDESFNSCDRWIGLWIHEMLKLFSYQWQFCFCFGVVSWKESNGAWWRGFRWFWGKCRVWQQNPSENSRRKGSRKERYSVSTNNV